MSRRWVFALALLLAIVSVPPQWYPLPIRLKLTEWFGAAGFRALPESVVLRPSPNPSRFARRTRRVGAISSQSKAWKSRRRRPVWRTIPLPLRPLFAAPTT